MGFKGSRVRIPPSRPLIPKDLRAADIGGFFVIGHVFGHMCWWPLRDAFGRSVGGPPGPGKRQVREPDPSAAEAGEDLLGAVMA